MSGLSVLLETTTTTAQQQLLQCAGAAARTSTAAQVISKATFMNAATTNKIWVSPASSTCSSSSRAPIMAPPATAASCSFLQRCFLCRKELGDGVDIYIYRGDRAFCSEECRCRHILVEDSDGATDCARVAAAGRSRRRRRDVAGSGFAF